MKKWLVASVLMFASFVLQAQKVEVKSTPFPSNWQQLRGNNTIQIFPLSEGTSWAPLPQEQNNPTKNQIRPPMMSYGIYDNIVSEWKQTSPQFGFQLVDTESPYTDPQTIQAIKNNNFQTLFIKNTQNVYECYIPLKTKTSDYLRLQWVSMSLDYCASQLKNIKSEEANVVAEQKTNAVTNSSDCITTNKALPNVNGGLPGRRMGEARPKIACGFPVGSAGAKDVQIPLGQPFPNDDIRVGGNQGRNFNDLNRFCQGVDCSIQAPVAVPRIPNSWSTSNTAEPFKKQ